MLANLQILTAAFRQPHSSNAFKFSNHRFLRTASTLPSRDARRPIIKHAAPLIPAHSDLKSIAVGLSTILGSILGYFYLTDTRSSIHRWLAVPAIRYIYKDAENAHHAGISTLKLLYRLRMHPRERGEAQKVDLSVHVFGYVLENPIGISAGIDKDADVPSALLALGPAIVEVGGVTPLPQEGNPKPRVFRIPSMNGLINRYGLNSQGADYVAKQLRRRVRHFAQSRGLGIDGESERKVLDGEAEVPPGSLVPGKLLAVQVSKNKTTPDGDIEAVKRDYVACVERLARYADIITVNVSSPNTPGLRGLQQRQPLKYILEGVVEAASSVERKTRPAVMVKVSPDEDSEEDVLGICEAVWASGVDGVIVGNTTNRRLDLQPAGLTLPLNEAEAFMEQGGYSGPQTFGRTVTLVKRYRQLLDETVEAHPDKEFKAKTIFATGGITNGGQALKILEAGADVAQIYSTMIYSGVGTITRIKDEMRTELTLQSKQSLTHMKRA